MTLTRIEAQNLKGRTFQYDLAPMVAISGQNFTGKSSIIDAIRLALIGYLPELGKTNAATARLASGEAMSVKVFLGTDIAQDYIELAVLPNGKVLRNSSAKTTETSMEMIQLFSGIPLLNASAYFDMTEQQRYNYVFEIAEVPEQFTSEAIVAECERISFGEEHTEYIEKAKNQVIAELRLLYPDRITVQEYLANRIERMKQWWSIWNQRVKDTVGAVRVMAELKTRHGDNAGDVRQITHDLKAANEQKSATFKVCTDLTEKQMEARRINQQKDRLKDLRQASGPSTDEEIKKIETRIEEATGMLKPKVPEPKSDRELAALREKATKLMSKVEAGRRRLQGLREQNARLGELSECPYCLTKAEGWKEGLQATINVDYDRAQADVETDEAALFTTKAECESAEEEARIAREILANNKEWNGKILMWNQQLDDLKKRQTSWLKEVERQEGELPLTIEEPTKEQMDEANDAYLEARKKVTELETKLNEAALLQHELKRAAEAEIEHLQAKALCTVIKAVAEVLKQKRAELVTAVFDHLLDVANSVAGQIILSPLAFHEGEVGRWDGHRWISHKTFSGTEQALTFVAIAMALSQTAPIKLLIFDEMGRLDWLRQEALVEALRQAIAAKYLDQVILAGATMTADFDGFKEINLSKAPMVVNGEPELNVMPELPEGEHE